MSFQNFDQIINLKVKIITLLDQIIIGQIYTYSSSNEIIIIKTKTNINDNKQNSGVSSTYRIINTAFIKSIQVLPPFQGRMVIINRIHHHHLLHHLHLHYWNL